MSNTNRLSQDEWINRLHDLQNKIEEVCQGMQEGIVISAFTKTVCDFLVNKDIEERKILVNKINMLLSESLKILDRHYP